MANDPVRSRVQPTAVGPTIAPTKLMLLLKPNAVPSSSGRTNRASTVYTAPQIDQQKNAARNRRTARPGIDRCTMIAAMAIIDTARPPRPATMTLFDA